MERKWGLLTSRGGDAASKFPRTCKIHPWVHSLGAWEKQLQAAIWGQMCSRLVGWKIKSLKGLLSLSEFMNRGVFSLYTHSAGWGWGGDEGQNRDLIFLRPWGLFKGILGRNKNWRWDYSTKRCSWNQCNFKINSLCKELIFLYCKSSPKSSNYCSVKFVNVTLGHMDLSHFTFIKLGIYQCFGGL